MGIGRAAYAVTLPVGCVTRTESAAEAETERVAAEEGNFMDSGCMHGKGRLATEFLPIKDVGGESLLDLGCF